MYCSGYPKKMVKLFCVLHNHGEIYWFHQFLFYIFLRNKFFSFLACNENANFFFFKYFIFFKNIYIKTTKSFLVIYLISIRFHLFNDIESMPLRYIYILCVCVFFNVCINLKRFFLILFLLFFCKNVLQTTRIVRKLYVLL